MIKNIIIIPTYNERDNISILLERIFNLIPDTHVLVIDDSSPDGTADAVEKLKNKYPNLSLLKRPSKNGLGGAYIAGFKKSMEDFDAITMMDADLSHNPKYLPEMLRLTENFDLVIGSRYIPNGGVTKKWKIWRRLLSAGGNLYLRLLFYQYPVNDWTTGYNVIKTNALKKINFNLLSPKGYAFISSLKYYLVKTGVKIKESPIFFEERNGGESKISWSIILEGIAMPWKIIIREFFR